MLWNVHACCRSVLAEREGSQWIGVSIPPGCSEERLWGNRCCQRVGLALRRSHFQREVQHTHFKRNYSPSRIVQLPSNVFFHSLLQHPWWTDGAWQWLHIGSKLTNHLAFFGSVPPPPPPHTRSLWSPDHEHCNAAEAYLIALLTHAPQHPVQLRDLLHHHPKKAITNAL